jgi:ABC-type iron transport system FetAB permease component
MVALVSVRKGGVYIFYAPVKYKIMIMFLITAGAMFGTIGAVWLGARCLFDHLQRLRLDRVASR